MVLKGEKRNKYMKKYYKNNPKKYEEHKLKCKLNAQKKRQENKK